MDDKIRETLAGPIPPGQADCAQSSDLAGVITSLQEQQRTLESFDLTLAVALLDHAIEEVRKHISG